MRVSIVAVVAAVALSQIATPAFADPYQVVRAGDGQMTCDALMTEINGLNDTIRRQAERAQRNAERNAQTRQAAGRVGRGFLSALAQGAQYYGAGALGVGGSDSALTNMAASAAVSTVADGLAGAANAPVADAPPPPAAPAAPAETPERQRITHLTTLFGSRC